MSVCVQHVRTMPTSLHVKEKLVAAPYQQQFFLYTWIRDKSQNKKIYKEYNFEKISNTIFF